MAPVIGSYPDINYNILFYEEEYIKVLKRLAPTFPYIDKDNPELTNKRWYHILQGLFILDNYSYELTAAQRELVNLAHQGKCPRE